MEERASTLSLAVNRHLPKAQLFTDGKADAASKV